MVLETRNEEPHMRALLVALALTLSLPALAYPTIGANIRELSGDWQTKIVDFHIRNTTEHRVDGYFYEIRMFNSEGLEILSRGRRNSGYKPTNLIPGGITRERIYVQSFGTPVRVEVDVMLVSPTETGDLFIQ